MIQPLPVICHLLIGLPASGKSTFAKLLAEEIKGVVVSTDTIRESLYGDEATQGSWTDIEREVCCQIREAVAKEQPVIYDATNAARLWRMGFLQKQIDLKNVQWIGWYLEIPVDTCKERNKKRDRIVPDEVIDKMNADLQQFPPEAGEGMLAVYPVPLTNDEFDREEIRQKIKGLNRVLTNRANLNKNKTFHQYSRLLNFERLIYLISVIVNYPGIGNLAATEPETLKEILDLEELPEFHSSIAEISAVIAKKYHSIYAQTKAIEEDLSWLQQNGLLGEGDVTADLVRVDSIKGPYLATHRYSDIEQFDRLVKLIRFILYRPFVYYQKGGGAQESLIYEMCRNYKIFDFATFKPSILRKDIEECLNPYQILPGLQKNMRKGYFAGTAILSKSELNRIFQLLQSQSQDKYFQDPLAGDLYDTFQKRMIDSHLLEGDEPYPVRVIGTKSILNVERHRVKIQGLETAIKNGELLEFDYIEGSARWTPNGDSKFRAYPLQIVFHNIAWYLGYEIVAERNNGLLAFERIDRVEFINTRTQRDISEQIKSLDRLNKLYTYSAGLYLGDNVEKQKDFLKNSQERQKLEKQIVIGATDKAFKFICEGNERFDRIEMSVPTWFKEVRGDSKIFNKNIKEMVAPYKHTIKITIPEWSLKDIDLIRWISGWGKDVKVIEPEDLAKIIHTIGEGIEEIYQDIEIVICELNNVNSLTDTKPKPRFISINSSGISSEPESVREQFDIKKNCWHHLTLSTTTILNSPEIEKAVAFIKKVQGEYRINLKQIKPLKPRILVYSHSGISLASEVAIALYTALTQDSELAALRISLNYR